MNRIFALLILTLAVWSSATAGDGQLKQFSGRTMGTTYVVKVYEPTGSARAEQLNELQLDVDAVLRSVNDQMSTYLQSSEISRFNASQSTDWIAVSPELAMVVDVAQTISEKSGGGFDVTVGPLVNAWNFGPDPRTGQVPDPSVLEGLKEFVGYQKLAVRRDPPALRKQVAGLKVDLSAIAKGYGVDRVVETLNAKGAANVFVEIGGEVRTSGDKDGQWWKVGIQMPDATTNDWTVAHALSTGDGRDQSMATSGDYRNFFEAGGVRYSHTIDPRTGEPITHALASVSVVAESCMEADGWATAINVLGPDAGLRVAKQENLDALLILRQADGFVRIGTGTLAQYSTTTAAVDAQPPVDGVAGNPTWVILGITFIAFALVLAAMAIGVIFGRRAISGSCGGLANRTNEDGSVSCSLCSNPADACKELRERIKHGEQES